MLMKLRWLLKSFFIAWLIGLPISFSSAIYYWWWINVPIGEYVQLSDICNDSDNAWVNTYITFDTNLNIKYIENWIEYKGARLFACGWAGTWSYLYWNHDKLSEGFGAREYSWQYASSLSGMWYINNVCITSKWSSCYTWNSISMEEFTNIKTTWESFSIIPYDELNWVVSPCNVNQSCLWWYNQPISICFNNATSSYCVAVKSSWNPLGTTYYNPIPIWQANINASIDDWSNYFSYSPMRSVYQWWTALNPSVDPQKTYNDYRKLGYSDALCYWWFGLNDLFGTWNSSFYNVSVWSGATIFQLYNTYSWWLSYTEWYNQWYYDYWYFQQFHDSYEYEKYIWKSKGLIGLFMIKDIYFTKDNFNPSLLFGYCALSLTNTHIDKTQSPIDVINDSVNDNKLDQVIGDIWILIPWTWSALDQLVWTLKENWVAVDWSWDFTAKLSDLRSGAFNSISSMEGVWSGVGVLPGFIWLGFLAFALLYLLKK